VTYLETLDAALINPLVLLASTPEYADEQPLEKSGFHGIGPSKGGAVPYRRAELVDQNPVLVALVVRVSTDVVPAIEDWNFLV
jgi:hypothetical protein